MRNAARADVEFGVTSHPRKVKELNTKTEDFPQVNSWVFDSWNGPFLK